MFAPKNSVALAKAIWPALASVQEFTQSLAYSCKVAYNALSFHYYQVTRMFAAQHERCGMWIRADLELIK